MPTSVMEGKDWLMPRIVAELPGSVLDIGAGEGTYAYLLAEYAEQIEGSTLTAIEIHKPYVEKYALKDLYDKVIVANAVTRKFPRAHVVILGDIIEHLDHDDAVKVWNKARAAARRAVFASIPLGDHPQGEVQGNPHERHRTTWTDATVHALGGVVASWTGPTIGAYAIAPS